MNASVDMANSEVLLKQAYHIGIAVDTPDGLMVPVIKNADQLSIFEIAREIERLSQGARARTLQIAELKDSTFSITNYGSVGSSFGVPIIRYPEAGIMGVGSIQKKPVVIEDEIVIREILPLSLSFDHRIIDGADAGRFVNEVKRLLSNPKKLILM
jgi:pyruvate dehydrogenase E2 component (dihydrolipoamide acetyltransferase)